MTLVFEVIDKSGRKVRLTRERWAHILKHPEMANQVEPMKETLENPDFIQDFDYDLAVRCYYKYYKNQREYLYISVKYLNGDGFIITSFYTDRIL